MEFKIVHKEVFFYLDNKMVCKMTSKKAEIFGLDLLNQIDRGK